MRLHPRGLISRAIATLSEHGFSAFDALMVPFHCLFAAIMLATPQAQIDASPVYGRLTDIAPVNVWAGVLIALAVAIVLGIVVRDWAGVRIAYTLMAGWWLAISWLVYLVASTLLSPAVYVLMGVTCLYRQAEILVEAKHGRQ